MEFDGILDGDDHHEMITSCKRCSTGVMQLSYITHYTWLDEELITVPISRRGCVIFVGDGDSIRERLPG